MQNILTQSDLRAVLSACERPDCYDWVRVRDLADGVDGYATRLAVENMADHCTIWVAASPNGSPGCFTLRGNLIVV